MDALEDAKSLGFKQVAAAAAKIDAAKRRASDAYGDCMSEFASGSHGRLLKAHAPKCEAEAKKEFEKLVSLGWEAVMDRVKAVGTAKAEGKPVAFKEKPEITSTVRFSSKCSNIEESKVAADVHASAGDAAAAGSTVAKKFADGDACLVVSHTPVKAGKGDEAAANVMAGFSKTRRRLNSHNAGATVSSSTTYEDTSDSDEAAANVMAGFSKTR